MECTDLCLVMNVEYGSMFSNEWREYGSMFSNEWREYGSMFSNEWREYGSMFSNERREYRFMFSNEWREYGSISMLVYWRYLQAGGLSLLGTFFFLQSLYL